MSINYKDCGVDVERGYKAVELMKKHTKSTFNKNVLGDLGSFGGFFSIKEALSMRHPVLVSGTDGVGTKLKYAFLADKHNTIGIDAVAMCVNDVVCHGARPLFFLDYIASGKIEPERIADIVGGISNGCVQAGCALIGGETAEMPGFYQNGEYDIAGFCVGIVDEEKIINGKQIIEGDTLIGIPSSGFHSNGYSLIRRLFGENRDELQRKVEDDATLMDVLLRPTRIYVSTILSLIDKLAIKGIAHITGGGFIENIPRIFPKGIGCKLNLNAYKVPFIFNEALRLSNMTIEQAYNTLNMGIGMVIAVSNADTEIALNTLMALGEAPCVLGHTIKGNGVSLC